MNFGLRKMQMSRAVVPPNRIRPIQRCPRPDGAADDAPALPAPVAQRGGDALEADAARGLHEHGVAGAQQLGHSSAAAAASGSARDSPPNAVGASRRPAGRP